MVYCFRNSTFRLTLYWFFFVQWSLQVPYSSIACKEYFSGTLSTGQQQHQERRNVYEKHAWKEQDIVIKSVSACNAQLSYHCHQFIKHADSFSERRTLFQDRTIKLTTKLNRMPTLVVIYTQFKIIYFLNYVFVTIRCFHF